MKLTDAIADIYERIKMITVTGSTITNPPSRVYTCPEGECWIRIF